MGRCKSLGALKLFLEYVSFNYPGPVSCFLHPDSSSGYTEGEGWVVQLFIQEWQEHYLLKWQAAFFFFFGLKPGGG